MTALGELVRRLRERAGLTQEELADRAGVSARTISDTERGVRRRLYADTTGRLAAALGLDEADRESFAEVARGRQPPETDAGLPHPLTPLVGRARELEALVADLQPGGRRLVTVTGLGGVGKTRLALAVAERLVPAFSGRVRFVRFAQGSEAGRLVDAVASSLRTSPSSIPAGVAGRPTLVVLDAFEHVLTATDALADLVAHAPELQVLVTSRERLGVRGEREVVLGPLPPDAAGELFRTRLHDVAPQTPDDPHLVARICDLLSGLPLPLELAAARARYLPLALLRDQLSSGVSDVHQVVEEAVTWSLSSLTADQRTVLAAATMFDAGWSLEGLRSVCGDADVIAALGALADRSLVQLDPGGPGPRWRMLDVVREIAAGLAPERPGDRAAFTRHCLRLLDEVSDKVGHEGEWFQVLTAEEPNIRKALAWAEEDRDASTVLGLATGMWLYWQTRGGLDEGRRWLTTGLALEPPAGPRLRAAALWGLGWLAYHQADDAAAEDAGRQLADLAAERDDPTMLRNALTIEGMVAIGRDQPDESVAHLAEALAVAQTLDHPWILATSHLNLGLGHLASARPDRARSELGEALAAYGEIGDERFHARCLGYLGLASLLDDDPHRAGALFGQSLRTFAALGEPAGTAEGLAGLSAVAAATNDAERAATLGGAAERLHETVGARELPLERKLIARYVAHAERGLGTTAWTRAWTEGRELTLSAAVSLALSAH